MSFWAWALKAYALPGVATACLELQDSHRQSVPYLLWAAWAAARDSRIELDTLRRGSLLAAQWETAAAGPLRAARRGLKAPLDDMDDDVREALRAEAKALELKAEQALIAALEALTPAPSGASAALDEALARASDAWAFPAPRVSLDRLAGALPQAAE